jgi:DNA-directed RNA polymerase specialized sigma24 family protein
LPGGDGTEALVAALYPGLRRFAAVVAPMEQEPDDLVQDALAATIARQPLVELDDPLAYLRVVMVRLAANERRRLGRKRRASGRIGPEPEAVLASYPSDLAELDRLSPADRAVLYLTVIERRPDVEVAQMFDQSASVVKMRRHRALRKLHAQLEEEGDG